MTFSLLWAYAFIRRAPGWQVTAELLSNFSVTNTHGRRKKYSLSGCHIQIPYGEEVQRGVWYTLSHSRWQYAVLTFACLMLEPQGQIAEAMHTVEEWVAGENRWQHAALINFERDVADRCIRQRETKTVVCGKRGSWRGHTRWILRQSESSQVCVSVYILKFVFLCPLCGCVHIFLGRRCPSGLLFSWKGSFLILPSQQMDRLLQTSQEAISPNRIWSDTSPRLTARL